MADAPTYPIKTIHDFLLVPEDRIDACLAEFRTFLEMARATVGLLDAVSDEMTTPGAIRWGVGDTFRWIDDGNRDITINVKTGESPWTRSIRLPSLQTSPPRAPRCEHCGAILGRLERPLTRKQSVVYDYLVAFYAANGFAPSIAEIANGLGYRSLASIHEHLQSLERKGWIRRRHNQARAIELLVPLQGAA